MKTLSFDPTLPEKLKKTQQWFGSIISRPIDMNSKMNPVAPSGRLMETEARQFIRPGPKLKSHQRIEIYNQQYWWRLLSTLQEMFPLVTRLFGSFNFNQTIGIPYLVKYPPDHWSLNFLGNNLPQWVSEKYCEKDKQFVLDATKLDFAFSDVFLKKGLVPLNEKLINSGDLSQLLEEKLILQPYVHIFSLPYDLFSFRQAMIKEEDSDFWIDHDFPPLEKGTYSFVLFRNHANDIAFEPISEAEYLFLKRFQVGSSIDQACDYLETHHENLMENIDLAKWFQKWTMRHWLSLQ